LPDGYSAASIINNYIKVIGGLNSRALVQKARRLRELRKECNWRLFLKKMNQHQFYSTLSMMLSLMKKQIVNKDKGYLET